MKNSRIFIILAALLAFLQIHAQEAELFAPPEEFRFTVKGVDTINPKITKWDDGRPRYVFSDGTAISGTDVKWALPDTNEHEIVLQSMRIQDLHYVTLQNCGLQGTLDLRPLKRMHMVDRFDHNPGLKKVIFPESPFMLRYNQFSYCDLQDTVDMRPLKRAYCYFYFDFNPNLHYIHFPSNNDIVGRVQVNNCDLTGTLDLTPLQNMTNPGGVVLIYFYSNRNLTGVKFPNSNGDIMSFYGHYCNLQDTIDFSGLPNMYYGIELYNNAQLPGVILPPSAKRFVKIWIYNTQAHYIDITKLTGNNDGVDLRFQSNQMTAEEVNHTLVDIDNKGWINGTLYLHGNNAAPDTSSGGYNGRAAKTNLLSKGWTIVTK